MLASRDYATMYAEALGFWIDFTIPIESIAARTSE